MHGQDVERRGHDQLASPRVRRACHTERRCHGGRERGSSRRDRGCSRRYARRRCAVRAAIVGQPTLPIRGKYRSEVEQAVHHALALALPGARYRVRARPDAGCGPVEIVAPAAHAGAFKALLTPLKRRAFRKQQSEYLVFPSP